MIHLLCFYRNAYGVSAPEKKPKTRHVAVQNTVTTKDQEQQAIADVNDTATLTDGTGMQSTDVQTDLSAFNTTEAQTQHEASCSDAHTETEKTGRDSNANAIYDLSYFAEEAHSMLPALHCRLRYSASGLPKTILITLIQPYLCMLLLLC